MNRNWEGEREGRILERERERERERESVNLELVNQASHLPINRTHTLLVLILDSHFWKIEREAEQERERGEKGKSFGVGEREVVGFGKEGKENQSLQAS